MQNIRQALLRDQVVVGSWINSGSPIIAELMSASGFDFLVVDVEHSAVDLPQTQQLFQAICSGNPRCAPMVRLHGVDYALVKRYLDSGSRGVICPLINTAEQARLLVQAVKYPPAGLRGVGYCRANNYGITLQETVRKANNETLVAVQIEHIEGVRNLDEILSVKGIDAAFIGPYDLSASMGITGQFGHPDMMAARRKILEACKRHRVVPGIHVVSPNPQEVKQRIQEGYRLLAYSLDITFLTNACQCGLREINAGRANRKHQPLSRAAARR
jgi:2-dehydro-3-deoxyglucarate aldolase